MKRLLSIFALTLVLSACGSRTLRLNVQYDSTDAARRAELAAAVGRVMEGRMLAKKKKVISQELSPAGDAAVLTVTVNDAEAETLLREGIMMPFTMEIMKQVAAGQGDIVSEKFGEFKETGITTKDFDWVSAGAATTDAGIAKGSVTIHFTKAGETKLKNVFAKNRGSVIGVFVRGQLMSKKLVDTSDKQTSIAIDGIPSAALAGAFADDVNVGLHVQFTPVQ
jgi:ribosomal protein L25 (general stress protein Ctc)